MGRGMHQATLDPALSGLVVLYKPRQYSLNQVLVFGSEETD